MSLFDAIAKHARDNPQSPALLSSQQRLDYQTLWQQTQRLANQLQQQIADIVAQRVVEVAKVIQINQQQRAMTSVARACCKRLLQAVKQQPTIGQFRQRVAIGQ